MDRSIQPGLMILGCAALIVTAVLLPGAILRPASQVAPLKENSTKDLPVKQTPDAATRVTEAAVPEEAAGGDGLSRGQRFRIVEQRTIGQLGLGGLSSSLAKAFGFPVARNDAIFGIDVSHHNTDNCKCQIDWNLAASQKVAFVYAKASEGTRFRDPTFDGHWRALAQQQKIFRGAYHFLSADIDPEAQAKFFLQKMGKLQSRDLPPVMDLEWDIYPGGRKWAPREKDDYWSNLGPDEILDRALKWLRFVEKETGRIPIVYTSRSWWMDRIKDEKKLERLKRYPIWISAMEDDDLRVEKPGVKGGWATKWDWKLWQFTNRGDLSRAGIKNPPVSSTERVDVNIFAGSLEGFQQAMGIAATIEVAKRDIPDPTNAKPDGATPGGGGSGGGTVAPKETPKDTSKESRVPAGPGTDINSGKPNDSNAAVNPATGGGATPTETRKDPPKETQTPSIPGSDSNTNKPIESNAASNPATGGGPVTPDEPQKEPPKGVQTGSMPGPDGVITKPNESSAAVNPGTGGGVVAPDAPQKDPSKEAQVASTPAADSNAGKPDESSAAVNPGTGGGVVAPDAPQKDPSKEAQVASTPAADSNAGKPNESSATVNPGPGGGVVTPDAPQKVPPKETQVASTRATESNAASNPGTGTGATALPMAAPAERPLIEIVLKNGRVIRADPSVDPAVLIRLVELLEKE